MNPDNPFSRYEIVIHNKMAFAEVRFFGQVTLDLVNTAFMALMNHQYFRHNMHACYDFSDAIIETDVKELELHSDFVVQLVNHRGTQYKLALVSNETLNSALLNVYRLLISKTTVDVEVFGTKGQALLWLSKKD